MANQEQLAIVRRNIDEWNRWREQHPNTHIDLIDAYLIDAHLNRANLSYVDLSDSHLSGANLINANLSNAQLSSAYIGGAYLNSANLRDTNLIIADLSDARLNNSHLSRANLSGANLSGAELINADLSGTNLSHANLSNTELVNTNLSDANLSGANLSNANLIAVDFRNADLSNTRFGSTVLGDVDLQTVKGLDTARHNGPSTIGTNTLERSHGNIPETFLRGAGLSDTFIEYARSLVQKPIDYYTCFISYSSKDEAFAKRLYNDLQGEGVRCWFAPEDMKIGDKIRYRIDESIRVYDKLLIVLSEHSLASTWVENEVEAAFNKEQQYNKLVLFPIKLDETVMETNQVWAATIRRTRHIGNFTQWNDHRCYQTSFVRLLRDLKAESR